MNNINLPPDVEFHEDIRLFIYRPRGLLNEASVDRAVRVLEELEAKLKEPFNRFSDASAIDGVELNYQYVIQVSLYRVLTYADRPPVKSREREDAAKWLRVPIERLAPKSVADSQSNLEETK